MSTVYVLGAGATRGASFVEPSSYCKPPLDADFYTQLQRIANDKHQALIKSVAADAVTLFGTNFRLSLETMFTTLEYTLRMVQTTGERRDFKKTDLEARKNRLMQSIAATFEESLTETVAQRSSLKPRECKHHQKLVSFMKARETIISFNYDCLIDHALHKYGSHKWNAHYGYGFNLGSYGTKLHGHEFWQPQTPANNTTTVKLLTPWLAALPHHRTGPAYAHRAPQAAALHSATRRHALHDHSARVQQAI